MTGGSTYLERSLTGKPPVVFILHDLLGSTLVLQPGARYTALAVFDTEYHYARYQTFLRRRMPGTKELSAAQRSQLKPVTHCWWFRAVLLALFMLPAIAEVPYDPLHTTAVIQAVLAEPFVVVLPELLPLAKLLLFAVAALPRWEYHNLEAWCWSTMRPCWPW